MQASSAPPTVGTAPAPSGVGKLTLGPPSAPTTRAEMRALSAHRSEVSSQLSNITSRRNEIATQIITATGANKAGLESRLAVLDTRIVELEGDLAVTGKALASARGDAASYTEQSPQGGPVQLSAGQITGISIVFTIAVLMPLSLAWAKSMLHRASRRPQPPSPEITQRFDRLEEGIEAIAIEVERISEGQRFVTKVISGGAAERIAIPRGEPVHAERRP